MSLCVILISFLFLAIILTQGAYLPTVGGNTGTWGTILNTFLLQEHDQNGSHSNITTTSINNTGDIFLSATSLSSCTGKLITSSDGNITCGADQQSDLTNYALFNQSNIFSEIQNFTNAINLGNTLIAENGTIRWTGTDFQGYNGTEWTSLTTRADGGISPSFHSNTNDVHQYVKSDTWVKLNFSNEVFDTNDDYDATNMWFKPSVPGKYLLTTSIEWGATEQYHLLKTAIYKNGVIAYERRFDTDASLLAVVNRPVTVVVDADGVNDYFDVYVWHDEGTDLAIYGDIELTYFSGGRIDGGNGLWTSNEKNISYSAGHVRIGNTNNTEVQFEVGGDSNLTGQTYIGNGSFYANDTTVELTGYVHSDANFTISADNLFKLIINTTPLACDSANAGSIMYSNDNIHYGCNSTDWNALY